MRRTTSVVVLLPVAEAAVDHGSLVTRSSRSIARAMVRRTAIRYADASDDGEGDDARLGLATFRWSWRRGIVRAVAPTGFVIDQLDLKDADPRVGAFGDCVTARQQLMIRPGTAMTGVPRKV
jgi:hypothetical protein